MSEKPRIDRKAVYSGKEDLPELELSDEDILDAMRHIPGYLDISTQDFRAIYHLAHGHALDRLFHHVTVASLMRTGIEPLHPYTRLEAAARSLVEQGSKSLPVVDAQGRVIGILTETDYLRSLEADSFLQLLLRLIADRRIFTHRCNKIPVSEAMTAPAVTLAADAGFREIVRAFHAHEGRSMPVVDDAGRLAGLLLRKDFVRAYHLEDLL
jgi:CBS domain-containing membrane protein